MARPRHTLQEAMASKLSQIVNGSANRYRHNQR
jgi:hypothetical protein